MEYIQSIFGLITGSGLNEPIMNIFNVAPVFVGKNLWAILIGLWVLKQVAKKTEWVWDDKLYTLLSGLVTIIRGGGFTPTKLNQIVAEKLTPEPIEEKKNV